MSFPNSDPSAASSSPPITAVSWLPVVFGLLALYLPTVFDLGRTIWLSEEQAHAPIILAVSAWFFWQKRSGFLVGAITRPAMAGWFGLSFGLLLYVVGRSQDIVMFETASLPLVLAGVVAIRHGAGGLRHFWFPLLYLVFVIPLPGILIERLTAPLKIWNSQIVESLLYPLGLPIARDGVTLSIGPYQLLVSDACSGLHSMFSLSALGFLYMYIAGRNSRLHNGIMLASILPIALGANLLRVMLLVAITYYWGDEAGQSFMHGLSGIVLLLAALSGLLFLDGILARAIRQ